MKYAYLYRCQGCAGYELYVTASDTGINTPFCTCASKAKAREICQRQGFTPCNF